MKKLVNNIKFKIKRQRDITKAYNELNNLSDRCIADIGFSPHLVRLGKRGYPWR